MSRSGLPKVLPLIIVAGLAIPSRADRLSIGASVGSSEGKGGTDRISTRSVFGRLQLFDRLSIEGELGTMTREVTDTIQTGGVRHNVVGRLPGLPGLGNDGDGWDALRASATVRLDLVGHGRLIPHLLAGIGAERWSNTLVSSDFGRRELGAGLDLVVTGGLRIGLDLRAGERTLLDSKSKTDLLIYYMPSPYTRQDAPYLAGRLTIAAGF